MKGITKPILVNEKNEVLKKEIKRLVGGILIALGIFIFTQVDIREPSTFSVFFFALLYFLHYYHTLSRYLKDIEIYEDRIRFDRKTYSWSDVVEIKYSYFNLCPLIIIKFNKEGVKRTAIVHYRGPIVPPYPQLAMVKKFKKIQSMNRT